MSLRRPAKNQPENFEFNSSSLVAANKILLKYPEGKQQSAVMALLYIAQRQNDNWIPLAAMKYIAKFLDMPYIKVYEVATFYTMYNLSPVGKHFIQVCTTTPCMIRGASKLVEACKEKISEKEKYINDYKGITDKVYISPINGWSLSDEYDWRLGNARKEKRGPDICPDPFSKLAVNFNGTVSVCCVDWSHGTIVGDLNKESFYDVWNGEKLKNFRLLHGEPLYKHVLLKYTDFNVYVDTDSEEIYSELKSDTRFSNVNVFKRADHLIGDTVSVRMVGATVNALQGKVLDNESGR